MLYDGNLTPFGQLLELKHLANHAAYQQQNTPNTHWLNSAKTNIISGVTAGAVTEPFSFFGSAASNTTLNAMHVVLLDRA